jgi:hypothetical protein
MEKRFEKKAYTVIYKDGKSSRNKILIYLCVDGVLLNFYNPHTGKEEMIPAFNILRMEEIVSGEENEK